MKKQIRQGVFETNSSSTHAICIATESKYGIPSKVKFGFGNYGWEVDKLNSRRDRANYLYTCLSYLDYIEIEEKIKLISDILHNNGVKEIYYEDFKLCIYEYDGNVETYLEPGNGGYVDHGSEAKEFVNELCSNEKLLLDYLFSDDSFILTGNDNDDISVDIDVDYPHKEFYKWN